MLQDVSLFIDDSGPPAGRNNTGEKATYAPLTGQLVDQRNVGINNPDSPRYAATIGNGNAINPRGGLINAGSAYYGCELLMLVRTARSRCCPAPHVGTPGVTPPASCRCQGAACH